MQGCALSINDDAYRGFYHQWRAQKGAAAQHERGDAAWSTDSETVSAAVIAQVQIELLRLVAAALREEEQEGIWGPAGVPLCLSPDDPYRSGA